MPISVNALCDTRWEARIEALKPLRYHLPKLCDALKVLQLHSLEKKDGITASEASSLSNLITAWPFIISVVVWYDILSISIKPASFYSHLMYQSNY